MPHLVLTRVHQLVHDARCYRECVTAHIHKTECASVCERERERILIAVQLPTHARR